MRRRANHIRSRQAAFLVALALIVAWRLIITLGLGHDTDQTSQVIRDSEPILQRSTVAVGGTPTCDCGALRLVSKTQGTCEATAVAGGWRQGSGMCCVCEGSHSVVACGQEACTCGSTQVICRSMCRAGWFLRRELAPGQQPQLHIALVRPRALVYSLIPV